MCFANAVTIQLLETTLDCRTDLEPSSACPRHESRHPLSVVVLEDATIIIPVNPMTSKPVSVRAFEVELGWKINPAIAKPDFNYTSMGAQ